MWWIGNNRDDESVVAALDRLERLDGTTDERVPRGVPRGLIGYGATIRRGSRVPLLVVDERRDPRPALWIPGPGLLRGLVRRRLRRRDLPLPPGADNARGPNPTDTRRRSLIVELRLLLAAMSEQRDLDPGAELTDRGLAVPLQLARRGHARHRGPRRPSGRDLGLILAEADGNERPAAWDRPQADRIGRHPSRHRVVLAARDRRSLRCSPVRTGVPLPALAEPGPPARHDAGSVRPATPRSAGHRESPGQHRSRADRVDEPLERAPPGPAGDSVRRPGSRRLPLARRGQRVDCRRDCWPTSDDRCGGVSAGSVLVSFRRLQAR